MHLQKRYFIVLLIKCRVRECRNGSTPVLYLNAGDTYMGTPWFNIYKDRIVTEFMNLLKPDAIVSPTQIAPSVVA